MDMKDADKTTFIVKTGTYRFHRVPFGLFNVGSTFQGVMELALNGLNFYMCLVYLDDIIVYSKTVEEHLLQLKKLFDKLRTANLKLKPSKCHLPRAANQVFRTCGVGGRGFDGLEQNRSC